jgi:hypothetical protein
MRESNFIAFWVVFGFFMGLLASFYNWNDPFDILSGVIIVTFFFYLVAHVSVALETKGEAHQEEIRRRLKEAGFAFKEEH